MISIVMPYWNRQWAAGVGIDSLVRCYESMDIELVVVDDGSKVEPFVLPKHIPDHWRVVIERMPLKDEPKNPCAPINIGVALSTGDVLCLTGPEMVHYTPILPDLVSRMEALGPDGYALAAVWSVDQGRWHQHSSHTKKHKSMVAGIRLKCGLSYHFCSVMRRHLWDRVGGMDEQYRDGAGYDDPDLALRLHQAGAVFNLCDDLVVWHPRKGARVEWTKEMFERNRVIFTGKWERLRKKPKSDTSAASSE